MIEVKNITKTFGRKKILKGLSFTAEKGEITCLIGINGAGKTTALNAIMNLTPLTSGQILIDGKQLTKESYQTIAFIPDTIAMLSQMTIKQAMAFMHDFYTTWNQQRANELLEFFQLTEKEKIANL
jgi:ABC-2 type transport system ATP-binding protein